MLVDYYKVLGIDYSASFEEIRTAYRSLSKKWHPDLNPDRDVTSIMQQINEAYYILGNPQKRERYNVEYLKYQDFCKQTITKQETRSNSNYDSANTSSNSKHEYNVSDENVKNDIENARKRAKQYVDEFMRGLKENNRKAIKSGGCTFITYIIVGILMSFIAVVFSHC